ncbi:MAG TPA: hypothetical protein VGH89_35405 [Pseudonocardia sp.]|jgi:hypothetical protein
MMFSLLVLILFGLFVYAQHRTRRPDLYARLPGRFDAEDYEAARFRADLRAARDHQQSGRPPGTDYREPDRLGAWTL